MQKQRIRIKLRAYDFRILDKSTQAIVDTAKRTGADVNGPMPLPTAIRRYTGGRSRALLAAIRNSQVRGDARQSPVFQRVHRLASAAVEPHARADDPQRLRPFATQPAGTEMGLGLTAPLAPGRTHGTPARPAHGTDEVVGPGRPEQPVTHQALGREQQLLEGARHGARARPPRA